MRTLSKKTFIDLYKKNYSTREIAEKLGISPSSVHNFKRKFNLPDKKSGRKSIVWEE